MALCILLASSRYSAGTVVDGRGITVTSLSCNVNSRLCPFVCGSLGHKVFRAILQQRLQPKAILPAPFVEFKRGIKGLFDEERALYEDMPKDLGEDSYVHLVSTGKTIRT